jgi:DNA-binding MarR family transcriptional regulator
MIFDQEPVTRLIGLASGIHIKTQRIAERELKAIGLTYAQFGVLTAIAEKDGRTQRELAVRLETDSNTLMVICDSLQKKGLAERRGDPEDRRIWRISMTPRGLKGLAKALTVVEGLYRPLSRIVEDREIQKALPLLEKLYTYLVEKEQKRDQEGS